MQAIRVHEPGGQDALQHEDIDDPRPGAGDVLVEVAFAGVNFIDTYQRAGRYPLPLPVTLGLEGSGRVVEVGQQVEDLRVGQRVAWTDVLGSYAQLVVVPADRTLAVPDALDDEIAAALPLQGITAHYLVSSTYELGEEDTALVYAAAGGVGRLLVQLAKLRGARVLACTSTEEKAAQVRALSADEVILYREQDVVATVAELTDGRGVDVVYDSVGADTFDASLDCLRPRGLMVLYGQASGPVGPIDPQILNQKGSLYLTRPHISAYTAGREEIEWRAGEVFELARTGRLDVRLHERYPLSDARQAHDDLESGATTGKLLLRP